MKITWRKCEPFLKVALNEEIRQIPCWCKVRNELNGLRPLASKIKSGESDIAYNTNVEGKDEFPVMPREFPIGDWEITCINPHLDPNEKNGYLYPFYIGTNAHQMIPTWDVKNGLYVKASGSLVDDYAYGLHFSTSDWTWGCIRIATEQDLRWMVSIIQPFLAAKERILFIVTQ